VGATTECAALRIVQHVTRARTGQIETKKKVRKIMSEKKEIMETEGDVTWTKEELFKGSGEWHSIIAAFWLHPFTWKLIAIALAAITIIHFGATFALALERDSVYQTTGSAVRFHYERPLFELPGYDVVLRRREFHDKRKTMAEVVREERQRELERMEFQNKRLQYQKQNVGLAELPDAPGEDILGELGMRGPAGH
jgi:hypothetical protein